MKYIKIFTLVFISFSVFMHSTIFNSYLENQEELAKIKLEKEQAVHEAEFKKKEAAEKFSEKKAKAEEGYRKKVAKTDYEVEKKRIKLKHQADVTAKEQEGLYYNLGEGAALEKQKNIVELQKIQSYK